jgi:CBS domain-containing protein
METQRMRELMKPQDFPKYETLPVLVIAEPVPGISADLSVGTLMVKAQNAAVLPVLDSKKRLLGVISTQDVLRSPEEQLAAIRANRDLNLGETPVTLGRQNTIAEAIARFGEQEAAFIPLVDSQGRYTGQCASRIQLYRLLHGLLKPARIGGLATPLGVYMTSGYHCSGAGLKGLIAAGMLFGVLVHILDWLALIAYSATVALFPNILTWAEGQQLILQAGITMVCLLSMLRLSPLSGLHAAEHMTINAIENDLPLMEPLVRTQPREHVRCGTNLMVFIGGIQLLLVTAFFAWREMNLFGLMLYLSLWAFIIFRFWQPAGLWLQRHFTTKIPTSAQLTSGILAGEELLEKFRRQPHPLPSLGRRLWGSGLPHMAVSFILTAWLIGFLLEKLVR